MDSSQLTNVLILSLLAGAAIPLGGILGGISELYPKWLDQEWRHGIIAFGGGALISAVSLVLVPDGIEHLDIWTSVISFLGGGVAFAFIDYQLSRKKGAMAQLMAMLLDFIPEAIALGAALTEKGSSAAILLAFLIALQNLPEGFNAFREIKDTTSMKMGKLLLTFAALALLGPLSALLGAEVLAGHKTILGILMLFSSGGILYLTFQDIAPQAKLQKHWLPTLGAVIGFALGLTGHLFAQG